MIEYRRDISGWNVRWDEAMAQEARLAGFWPDRTVADYAEDRVAEHPDRIQMIDGNQNLSCRRLWDEALAIAGYMSEAGVIEGDVVSYQLPPWYESATLNLAAAIAGAVLHPILPMYRHAELAYMLREAGSKLLFLPDEFRGFDYATMARAVARDLPNPPKIILVRPRSAGAEHYGDVIKHSPLANRPRIDPDAIKLILFTSGTTGRSKGVLHTHNTIHADGRKIGRWLGLDRDDMTFSPSPVGHVSGAFWAHNMVWLQDMPVVLQDRWDPAAAFDLIDAHQCTFVPAATPFLQDIVAEARKRQATLPSLRFWAIGGAAVPAKLVYDAIEIFPNVIPFRTFGATEVPTMTAPPLDRKDIRYAAETDGKLLNCEIKVVDPVSGEAVAPGAEGEIYAREASMALGYAREEDNLEAYDSDGFFKMGDLVRIVDDEFVVVTGRKKDIIIRAGENISAKEIEDALFAHEKITDVAVVSMPSVKTGEAICAFIVPTDNSGITLPEVAEYLRIAGLARQKTPEYIALVEALPRTASGKVQKHILRDQAKSFAD